MEYCEMMRKNNMQKNVEKNTVKIMQIGKHQKKWNECSKYAQSARKLILTFKKESCIFTISEKELYH